MAITIREQPKTNIPTNTGNSVVYEYTPVKSGIPNAPQGMPIGSPVFNYVGAKPIKIPPPPAIDMPESGLLRALNYGADMGGCGYWRLYWPETILNAYNKGIVSSLTQMIMDVNFYRPLKSIRMQRQATDVQLSFIRELCKLRSQTGLKIIYEIDDLVFREDIPDYNRCKDAFVDQKIVDNILEIMKNMDEITVTCDFMREYYREKTGNKNITVIPNYPPKFWLDRFYDKARIEKLWHENRKRPRILYAGSGTHIDVLNRTGGQDDFGHVLQAIIKARKDFKFVFKGAYPIALKPFVDSGEMEFKDWSPLFDLPQGLYDTGCQAVYAPLVKNNFNMSKSNIKMIESGGLGIPGAFQDLCTYQEAPFKFDSGEELIDQLKNITCDFDKYMESSSNARKYVEGMWLEDHIDEHFSIYYTGYGSKERNEKSPKLIELNPDQKIV